MGVLTTLWRLKPTSSSPLRVWHLLLSVTVGSAAVPGSLLAQAGRADPAAGLHRSVVLLEVASPRYVPARFSPHSSPPLFRLALPDTLTRRPTYWIEGAIIGGAVLGLGAFVLVLTICEDLAESGGCLGSAALNGAIGAFAGGMIGALIGGGVDKHPATDASESPLRWEEKQ